MADPQTFDLAITEADHDADVFRTLGGAAFLTREEQVAAFEAIPAAPAAPHDASRSWVVDFLDGDSISAGREISGETARRLLGVEDLDALREQADRNEEQGQALAEAWLAARSSSETDEG